MLRKIQEWAFTVLAVSIALLALVGVLLFAWNAEDATPWRAMNASEWGVWVGSIGTIGALFGTIWLATESERRRRREQLDLAMIGAARFALWIPLVQGNLMAALKRLDELTEDDPSPVLARMVLIMESAPHWDNQDLMTLANLPDHAGIRLALITTKLRWVIDMLKNASSSSALDASERMNAIDVLRRNMEDVLGALESPRESCIVFLEAHGFTGDEYD